MNDLTEGTPPSKHIHGSSVSPATPPRTSCRTPFTPRQLEVLAWVAQGKTDWQVAQILLISRKTVNYHVECAKKKLRVATRMQAVLAAVNFGLVAASQRP